MDGFWYDDEYGAQSASSKAWYYSMDGDVCLGEDAVTGEFQAGDSTLRASRFDHLEGYTREMKRKCNGKYVLCTRL